jgi:alkylhydroperoxidase family enzyme
MLRRIILNRLAAAERALGEPLDYMRYVVRTSTAAFLRIALLSPVQWARKRLPADAYYTAMVVATRHEDCGTCVQTVVTLARKEGVAAETLRAVLDRRPGALGGDLEAVYRFAEAVLENTGGEGELREVLRERYGDEGIVELATAITRGRFYPTLKRALGYATSCALVEVRV